MPSSIKMVLGLEQDERLEIIYRDERYIAVDKPLGLLVHRSNVDASESRFALQKLRDQVGDRVYPVHRIDKPTSGVLLFALDEEALVEAKARFSEGSVAKEYLAIVRGFSPACETIDRPLRKILDFSSKKKSDDAQNAATRLSTLAQSELNLPIGRYPATRYSLVSLQPETGRRHQLRRHLAGISHPIIGDTRYGDSRQNTAFRERYGFIRLFLHAHSLTFDHPFKDQPERIQCQAPADFQKAMRAVGLA